MSRLPGCDPCRSLSDSGFAPDRLFSTSHTDGSPRPVWQGYPGHRLQHGRASRVPGIGARAAGGTAVQARWGAAFRLRRCRSPGRRLRRAPRCRRRQRDRPAALPLPVPCGLPGSVRRRHSEAAHAMRTLDTGPPVKAAPTGSGGPGLAVDPALAARSRQDVRPVETGGYRPTAGRQRSSAGACVAPDGLPGDAVGRTAETRQCASPARRYRAGCAAGRRADRAVAIRIRHPVRSPLGAFAAGRPCG